MLLAIMRKAAMLLLAVIGFTAFATAQTVTGTVTDSKGDPVSGISVTVKGTTKGTSTNAQGVSLSMLLQELHWYLAELGLQASL